MLLLQLDYEISEPALFNALFISMLAVYHNKIIEEWISRGYRNSMKIIVPDIAPIPPYWLGNSDFHASHRSNLLRKDPEHYSQFGWTESDDLPYVWVT